MCSKPGHPNKATNGILRWMELKEYSVPLWKKITTEMNGKFFTEKYKPRRVLERIPKSMISLVMLV